MSFDFQNPEPGVYGPEVIPMDDYHGKLNAVGRSALKHLDEGVPADVQHYLAHGTGATQAMSFGTAFGMALLEPDQFSHHVVERPAFAGAKAPPEFRGAGSKARIHQWKMEHEGKVQVTSDEMAEIAAMVHAVKSSPMAANLLRLDLRVENTIIWKDEATGLRVKARPDIWRPDINVVADVKVTSGKLTDREVSNYVANYYAALQGAMCFRGLKALGHEVTQHTLLMVSRGDNPRVRRVTMKVHDRDNVPSWMEMGEAQFDALIAEYAECQRRNDWPDYDRIDPALPVPAFVACKLGHYNERAKAALKTPENAA